MRIFSLLARLKTADRWARHHSLATRRSPTMMLGVAIALLATPVLGQTKSEYQIRNQQEWLIWTVDYEGLIDGRVGPETIKGIKKFQARLGNPVTGQLTSAEEEVLERQGRSKKKRAGFEEVTDYKAGVRVGVPLGLVSDRRGNDTKWGKQWYGKEAGLAIDTLRLRDASLRQLYERLTTINNRKIAYQRFVEDRWFVIAAFEGDSAVYVRASIVSLPNQPPEIRGFSIWMSKNRPRDYEAFAPAMLSSFSTVDAMGGEFQPPLPTNPAPSPVQRIRTDQPAPSADECFHGLGQCPRALAIR